MINFVLSFNIYLSFIFALGILILFGLRFINANIARDSDIFFVTTGIMYCGILILHGWRLDPILLFSQALIITMVLFAGWENIRLRGLVYLNYLRSDQNQNKNK